MPVGCTMDATRERSVNLHVSTRSSVGIANAILRAHFLPADASPFERRLAPHCSWDAAPAQLRNPASKPLSRQSSGSRALSATLRWNPSRLPRTTLSIGSDSSPERFLPSGGKLGKSPSLGFPLRVELIQLTSKRLETEAERRSERRPGAGIVT